MKCVNDENQAIIRDTDAEEEYCASCFNNIASEEGLDWEILITESNDNA